MTAPGNGGNVCIGSRWRRAAKGCAALVIAFGCLAIIGWIVDSEYLRGIVPGLPAMNPVVALCWIACGTALILLLDESGSVSARRTAWALAAVVVLVAAIRLVGYALGVRDVLVDQILFRDRLEQFTPPNRMAPNTALGLLLIASSLLLIDVRTPRGRRPAAALALLAGLIALVSLVGNAYESPSLAQVGEMNIPMALNTALALGILSVGVLAARPNVGLMAVVTSDTAAGALLRRLLPTVLVIPFLWGYVWWLTQFTGFNDSLTGFSLFVVTTIVAMAGLVWWGAMSVNYSDRLRRQAEGELKRQTGTLESILQNLGDGVAVADADGRILLMNPAGERILGLGATGSMPDKWSQEYGLYKTDGVTLFPESDLPLARAVRGETCSDVEMIIRNASVPKGIWISVTATPMRDSQGQLLGGVGVFRDITERKQVEQDLRASREKARLIVDTAYDAFVAMDAAGRIVDWNRQAEAAFGWSRSEVLGRSLAETIIPERHRGAHRQGLQHFLETGEGAILNRRVEITALRRDGSEFPVELTISPLLLGADYIFNAFVHDITERKLAEQELKSARDAAEAANRAKSEFLANMSHEIRTPMNAIIGMTDLVLDTELTATQRDYLKMVEESGESLLTVINDILDFSKIEAGRLDLEQIPFSARERLGDAVKLLAFRAHDKGLELACRIHSDVPDALLGDPGRLRQIVVNLLGNAVKFTERGEVVLDVRCESRDEERATLHFTVTDTGIGIPAEKINSLFRAFEQGDASTTRRYGGTGLGLAISRRLVQLMGGRIWVESELGRGSEFQFSVSFQLAPEGALVDGAHGGVLLGNTPILIVDDNATNRLILQEMVQNWGLLPTAVSSATDALALLRRARDQNRPYRILLTDVNMPNVDGFTLTEWIRADPTLRSTIVMVLTSGARFGDLERCHELQIATHLVKPVKQSELFDAIALSLGLSVAEDHPLDGAAEFPQQGVLRILLAEDSVVNQKLAVGLLGKRGHQVTIANTGKEAVRLWEAGDFNLILMDVQMPEMDGMEATAVIRAEEAHTGTHIAIIAMTAHAMKGDREQCLSAGMDDYVSKPIRSQELFAAIQRVVGPRQPAPPQREFSPDGQGGPVDFSQALKGVDNDPDLFVSVVEAFLEECPMLLDRIRDSIQKRDTEVLRRSAHTLKGGLQTLAAAAAQEQAWRLELLGRDGQFDDALTAFSSLREQLTPVQAALENFLHRQPGAGGDRTATAAPAGEPR